MMPDKKPVDYTDKAMEKASRANAKKTVKPKVKASSEAGAKSGAEKGGRAMVDVYLAKLNATIYSDEYIPIAIRIAELSQKPMAKDYPPLSLTDKQLGRIRVEPHVLSITGKKERLVKTPDGEKHGVIDNAVVWMVFKFPSEFNLKRDEVEDIIGLLRFGFGTYGTCKIEEFNFIGKNYAEEP
jgi:hypothetical protein